MASSSLDLSLSLKPSYIPKNLANLLKDLAKLGNDSDRLVALKDYLDKQEEELFSVDAFKHDLPQYMLLVTDAVEELIKDMQVAKKSTQPLMEFLAMKRKGYEQQHKVTSEKHQREADFMRAFADGRVCSLDESHESQKRTLDTAKTSLLSSNQPSKQWRNKGKGKEVARGLGATNPCAQPVANGGLIVRANGLTINYHPKPLTQPTWKNKRRSWSLELHERFMEALNLLGGIEVATPKQIREVMQVEDLTNDQVKSHLQKYRLHNRRLQETYVQPRKPTVAFKDEGRHHHGCNLWKQTDSYSTSSQEGQLLGIKSHAIKTGDNNIEATMNDDHMDVDIEELERYNWRSQFNGSGRHNI